LKAAQQQWMRRAKRRVRSATRCHAPYPPYDLPKISEQDAKCFDRETSILDYAAHSKGFDGIVARNRQKATAIAHDNVLSLSK